MASLLVEATNCDAPCWHHCNQQTTAPSDPKNYLAGCVEHMVPVLREKGFDLRLDLDVVRLARNQDFDVAAIFCQDQDFAEVAQ